MGSVVDQDIECPKCDQEKGYLENWYKSGEFWFQCFNKECEYGHSFFIKKDDNYDPVTLDGTKNYRYDNLIGVETEWVEGKKTEEEKPFIKQEKDGN